ncbi:MAG: tRNA (adenosine(37)-N6)-threonylcarbamoyltransferase complex ATPase subunit type 1 TsaE [Proteobacteria bacterium]|nr:tRNA (adenosine(37)-N6)-threonylcarbamoyltransferase complex ATPase subunit type 1 TsaE [Pseudomonadota bacterium]
MRIDTHRESDTENAARALAGRLRAGDILLLSGDLGAGKTVFARALIRVMTGDDNMDVPSPTFTLLQTYDAPEGTLWHFDLYRIKSPEEIYELGWEEAITDGIVIVEWPEKMGSLAPRDAVRIEFRTSPEAGRILTVTIPEKLKDRFSS